MNRTGFHFRERFPSHRAPIPRLLSFGKTSVNERYEGVNCGVVIVTVDSREPSALFIIQDLPQHSMA